MKSPDDLLGRRLAWTHRVVHGVLDARMREEGADFTTWKVLAHLTDGEHPSQRELAARILIDPATLVPHLDRLEADGLVERARDERDRRVVRVLITPHGTSMHAALQRVADALDAELCELLTPDGYDEVLKAMQRISEHYAPGTAPFAPAVPAHSTGGAR
jgi:DNA-binding MarR family transcriptional regulator